MLPKSLIVATLLLLCPRADAQVHIIPKPVEVHMTQPGRKFTITKTTRIIVKEASSESSNAGIMDSFSQANFRSDAGRSVAYLKDYLKQYYRFTFDPMATGPRPDTISMELDNNSMLQPNAYTLRVDQHGVTIKGKDANGLFYGIQSLIQLLPLPDTATFPRSASVALTTLSIPFVFISDYPRFDYRGMHLDVARHFFPVTFIRKYIDYLALHKMNVLHWHLTDDQGWRIEIKKYPLLTQVGSWRNGTIIGRYPGSGNDNTPYGGYYTQKEIMDVIAYAADRFIKVIPEIEMPGHASAAIAAYPELSCFPDSATRIPGPASVAGDRHAVKKVQETWGVFEDVFCPTEYTFTFIKNVLDEVFTMAPAMYIHIGGDECPKKAWKKSAFCQQLMKEKGLKDEQELQSYFIRHIEEYINSKGWKIIGWDEILEGGLAPNATVMSWRGEKGGIAAANQGHYVIMTPGEYVYFDHSQSHEDDSLTIGGYTPLQKVYSYEPVPKVLDSTRTKYILGAQANVWTEYITNPAKVEYQIFPRMSALSEVLWSAKSARDWKDFEPRLRTQFRRYRLWNAHYSSAYFNPMPTVPTKKKE